VHNQQKIWLSMLHFIAVPPGHVLSTQAFAVLHVIVALLHGSLIQ
jgi:hypothetical protein